MPRSRSHRSQATAGSIISLFLREVLAAGAGIESDGLSIEALGGVAAEMRYSDFRDNLRSFFNSLKPFRRFGDFRGLEQLPTPRPLQLYVEPHILHGHFRAWLRRRGIDPDGLEGC